MIFSIRVDKTALTRRDKNELYNDLTIMALEKAFGITKAEKIILTASRKDVDESQNAAFIQSLNAAFGGAIEAAIKKPHEAKALQIADCASWGLFRYYENGDDLYYNELKPILYEYEY